MAQSARGPKHNILGITKAGLDLKQLLDENQLKVSRKSTFVVSCQALAQDIMDTFKEAGITLTQEKVSLGWQWHPSVLNLTGMARASL